MDGLKNTLFYVSYGVKDFFVGVLALRSFWTQSPNNRQQRRQHSSGNPKSLFGVLSHCLIFGALFWAGIFGFNHGILDYCIVFLESYLEPEERDSIAWYKTFLSILFGLLWTLPLFVISRILNYSWYQQIADLTFENTGGRKQPSPSISYGIGDQIESTVLQCFFMLQGYSSLVWPVPEVLRHLFLAIHLSILYALYSFEYKWVHMGWSLKKRLTYINVKWPYFLGFGLPLYILSTYIGSYIESICIFSTLFPIYVVSSTVTMDSRVQHYGFPIKFFGPAAYITNIIFVYLCSRIVTRARK